MKRNATTNLVVLLIAIALLASCTKPYDAIVDKTWEGQIYRFDDDKQLSDVKLKMSNDTLYLYSNAIFGAENDTLILQQFDKKDSTFTYNSSAGATYSFNFKLRKEKNRETLFFFGDDYYLVLDRSNTDLGKAGSLDFYRNMDVPREVFMYLDGAYEGNFEMENQVGEMFLADMGGVKMKLVFVDGFKVRVYIKNLLFDFLSGRSKPAYELVDYKIKGNKLILKRNRAKANTIEVCDAGEKLVLATDELNVVMHKIY